jgi:hypothetical protein
MTFYERITVGTRTTKNETAPAASRDRAAVFGYSVQGQADL